VASIKTVPYAELLKAANAALAQAQKDPGRGDRRLEWRPVRDGKYLPAIATPGACGDAAGADRSPARTNRNAPLLLR
jgi:hypothetical protein